MSLLKRNDTFTLIWKIHNFSMCAEIKNSGLYVCTPDLILDMLDKTEWYLSLESKEIHGENHLLCQLHLISLNSRPSVTINYSIKLVSIHSSNIKSKISRQTFSKKVGYIDCSLGSLDEIYNKKDILLPSDILTVQCCLWESGTHNSPKISAEQKVAVEDPKKEQKVPVEDPKKEQKVPVEDPKKSKSWAVEDPKKSSNKETTNCYEHIQEQKTLISHVYAQNVDELDPTLSEQMYLSAEKCLKGFTKNLLPNKCLVRTQIEMERRSILWAIKFRQLEFGQKIFMPVLSTKQNTPLILALYLFEDVEGACQLRIDIERDNDKDNVCVKCAIIILNAESEDQDCIQDTRLLAGLDKWHITLVKKNKFSDYEPYLKKDTLFLRCEFVISGFDSHSTVEVIVMYPHVHGTADVSDSSDFKKELTRIRKQGVLCDILLQVGQKSFGAHKVVLSASSTYFKDMFHCDFEEQEIEIRNCEPDTFEMLIKYIYSGVLEEIRLEDMMKLYSAANFFQVVGLKRLCSLKLKTSLNVSNVCDVLNIVDLHKDQFLKAEVGKFISEFSNEVFHSSQWKMLMESNPKLTGNIMYKVLTNKYSL